MNNFWQRVITGVLFVIVLAGSIFYHPFSFLAIFLLIVVAGVHEMKTLFLKGQVNVSLFTTGLLALIIFGVSFLVQSHYTDPSLFFIVLPVVCYLFIKELFGRSEKPVINVAASLFTACYIAAPFALLNVLAFENGIYDFHLPLSVFILVWINDTGAYLSGVTLGRHKFFERISPKKTWEGTIGGFLLTLGGAFVLSLLWSDLNTMQWMIFGGLISVMAVFGDLTESMFKRSIGVKDSGNVLPGHGGVLDRFDAVLFAIPMAVFYIELFVR